MIANLFRDRFNAVDAFAVSMASVAGYAGHYWWMSGIFAVQLLINCVAVATGSGPGSREEA